MNRNIFWPILLAGAVAAVASQPELQALIGSAISAGQPRVVIPPGVYRVAPEAGSKTHLSVRAARNLEIVADGVTMICTRRTRAVMFDHCENVTLRGLTVDYDPLPFTQGRVIAVAEDQGWIDVKLDAGYPAQPYARLEVCDPRTHFRKRGMPFLWGTQAAITQPGVVRVTLKDLGRTAQVGDPVSLSAGPEPGGIPHGIVIENSARMTLQDVTVHSAPGMGIIDAGGEGGTRLLGCKIILGPKPPGATADRLLTTSWDAILHKAMRAGPTVENCVIESAGDDSWSVTSSDFLVLQRAGAELVLAARDDWALTQLRAGDRLRASNDSPDVVIREARPVARAQAGLETNVLARLQEAKPWSLWQVGRGCLRVRLDRESPFGPGQSVFSPDHQGNGFVFRHNRIHSSGRGALVKASDGLIEDNLFDNAHAAVVVCPELPGEAAAGLRHLVIRSNTIIGTGWFCPAPWSSQAGAISISAGRDASHLRAAGVIEDVAIEGNTFRDVNGVNIVIASAHTVLVQGNRFLDTQFTPPNTTGRAYGIDQTAIIWLGACDEVRFEENVASQRGVPAGQLVVTGPATGRVVGAATGVRLQMEKSEKAPPARPGK